MLIAKICQGTATQHHQWVTADGVCISAVIADHLDLDRIKMLLDEDEEEDAWAAYFAAEWFPLTRGKTALEAAEALAAKLMPLTPEQLGIFLAVSDDHWMTIQDNFKWPVPATLALAVDQFMKMAEARTLERWGVKNDTQT